MCEYKKPLDLEKQINHLKDAKKIVFNDCNEDDAKDYLLLHNYINVITPFKNAFFKKDKNDMPIKDNDGNHIYENETDFILYKNKYENERNEYPLLFNAISDFETKFNAIVSYYVLNEYNLSTKTNFLVFVDELKTNVSNSQNEKLKEKAIEHFNNFLHDLDSYGNPYIFLDRLSFNTTYLVYKFSNQKVISLIFNELVLHDLTFGYKLNQPQFDDFLNRVIQIRNCVYHNNSLKILFDYYSIKDKILRKSTDERKFYTTKNKLIQYGITKKAAQ